MRSPIAIVDVDRPDSWTRYRAGLCARPEDWPYQGEIVPLRF